MKLYKEMMRKTAVIAIPLLLITLVYTLVTGGQDCFGEAYLQTATSASAQVPILRYYVFTAILFAVYGFSFQFSRASSDVYHSLPVKRSDLYVSLLLATATWMGGTILLNVLEMLFILLVSGCPFVPAYIPVSILFYFVAAMLVYGAAAVGCALSGTVVTALVSTGMVLFLPRFVQFLIARGIVAQVPIIGWLDLGTMLDPSTNVATGLIVMHSRQMFIPRIITMGHVLYSLIPMLAMLGIGWWLNQRRASELAHRNSGGKVWDIVMSVLLAFVVMVPITMTKTKILSVYGGVLVAAALGVYFVYQLIVTQNLRRVLKALPYFLLSVCMVLGLSFAIRTAAEGMRDVAPASNEIASVTFRGYDMTAPDPAYTTLLTRDIEFTDEKTRQYVAQTLKDVVVRLQNTDYDDDYYGYNYNQYQTIEPVTIKLTNGKTIKRSIEFANVDELNDLRMQNEAFEAAVKTFPPMDSIQFLSVDREFTPEENRAIVETYMNEAADKGLICSYYYRKRTTDMLANGNYVTQGENQTLVSGMNAAGYVGASRYFDSYTLRLQAPETVSLLMRTYNAYADAEPLTELQNVIQRFDTGLNADNDSLNVDLVTYNYKNKDGLTVQEQNGFYLSRYTTESEYQYDQMQQEYMQKFVKLLTRTTPTDDPTGVFIRLSWYYYDSAIQSGEREIDSPTVYLRFTDTADEQEYLDLITEWDAVQYSM